MRLVEFQDHENDEYSKADLDQARRPRLTLRHLNKLKNLNASKKYEEMERIKDYKEIYGSRFKSDEVQAKPPGKSLNLVRTAVLAYV